MHFHALCWLWHVYDDICIFSEWFKKLLKLFNAFTDASKQKMHCDMHQMCYTDKVVSGQNIGGTYD